MDVAVRTLPILVGDAVWHALAILADIATAARGAVALVVARAAPIALLAVPGAVGPGLPVGHVAPIRSATGRVWRALVFTARAVATGSIQTRTWRAVRLVHARAAPVALLAVPGAVGPGLAKGNEVPFRSTASRIGLTIQSDALLVLADLVVVRAVRARRPVLAARRVVGPFIAGRAAAAPRARTAIAWAVALRLSAIARPVAAVELGA